jgi:hypothetical protein
MTVIKFSVLALWIFIARCQRFGETCCLHLQGSSDDAGLIPSTSKHCHFSPEDGDSMFLQNVCIWLWIYVTKNPETSLLQWKTQTSHCEVTVGSSSWISWMLDTVPASYNVSQSASYKRNQQYPLSPNIYDCLNALLIRIASIQDNHAPCALINIFSVQVDV